MSLYNAIPQQFLNFLCVMVFTWFSMMTSSMSDINKLMMPTVLHFRRSIYFVESIIVSAITTILPISFLKIGIPISLGIAIGSWLYRTTILKELDGYLKSAPKTRSLNRKEEVRYHNHVMTINKIQTRYTATCLVNDTIISSCLMMSFLVFFSIICP